MSLQRTLKREVVIRGVGLHSGRISTVRLVPITSRNYGIRFERIDLRTGFCRNSLIRASWQNVISSTLCTVIGNRNRYSLRKNESIGIQLDRAIRKQSQSIWTVEHLLSAFYALDIDNVKVQIDGPEVPILDGSAASFMIAMKGNLLDIEFNQNSNSAPCRRRIHVLKEIFVNNGTQWGVLRPRSDRNLVDDMDIDVSIQFPPNTICIRNGSQRFNGKRIRECFLPELSAARTFCVMPQVPFLWKNRVSRGGSSRNAVIYQNGSPLNHQSTRFQDEAVRHKALDVVGDLALAGASLVAEYSAVQPSHSLNYSLLRKLFERRDNYEVQFDHRKGSESDQTRQIDASVPTDFHSAQRSTHIHQMKLASL
mmetsp:Transcript_1754/g.3125  ORF Transcript_1754/g.3125 Transcript_1754/m.3125 type:complete len:367 (-) Transcript_1754:94-1194(-)